jgi:uncharacterized protein
VTGAIEHIAGRTFHGRQGAVANAFSYGVDYLLLDPEVSERAALPWVLSRNRANIIALHDRDHGGAPGAGRGAAWVRELLAERGLGAADGQLLLLAQPRVLGHVFNPVSFWLCHDGTGGMRVVIAEVTNTYGDRHCYLCHHDDLRVIERGDTLAARKVFHVSPFQEIAGEYTFRFDIRPDRIGIWIDYHAGNRRLLATLTGRRRPATSASLLHAMLRRPLGSRRVLGLIHWQALKLWWKGARFYPRPAPPADEVSR